MKKVLLSLLCLLGCIGLTHAQTQTIGEIIVGISGNVTKSKNSTSYSGTFTITGNSGTAFDGKVFDVKNFNNYNDGWDHYRCGASGTQTSPNAYTASVETNFPIEQEVSEIVVKVNLRLGTVTDFKVYSGTTATNITTLEATVNPTLETITDANASITNVNVVTIPINNPKANAYYKVEFNGNNTGKNGALSLYSIAFNSTPKGDSSLSFAETEITLDTAHGEQDGLIATITPAELQGDVVYSVEDTTVATIDSKTGKITPIKPGTTTVKATFPGNSQYKGSEATYTLTIVGAEKMAPIVLSNPKEQYIIGDELIFTCDTEGAVLNGTLTSDNDEITITNETFPYTLTFETPGHWMIELKATKEGAEGESTFDEIVEVTKITSGTATFDFTKGSCGIKTEGTKDDTSTNTDNFVKMTAKQGTHTNQSPVYFGNTELRVYKGNTLTFESQQNGFAIKSIAFTASAFYINAPSGYSFTTSGTTKTITFDTPVSSVEFSHSTTSGPSKISQITVEYEKAKQVVTLNLPEELTMVFEHGIELKGNFCAMDAADVVNVAIEPIAPETFWKPSEDRYIEIAIEDAYEAYRNNMQNFDAWLDYKKADGFNCDAEVAAELISNEDILVSVPCSGSYKLTLSIPESNPDFKAASVSTTIHVIPSFDGLMINWEPVVDGIAQVSNRNLTEEDKKAGKRNHTNAHIDFGGFGYTIHYRVNKNTVAATRASEGVPADFSRFWGADGVDLTDASTLDLHISKNGQSNSTLSSSNSGITPIALSFSEITTGVDAIENEEGVVEVYTLSGVKVETENLEPGLYIVVKNGKASKQLVK